MTEDHNLNQMQRPSRQEIIGAIKERFQYLNQLENEYVPEFYIDMEFNYPLPLKANIRKYHESISILSKQLVNEQNTFKIRYVPNVFIDMRYNSPSKEYIREYTHFIGNLRSPVTLSNADIMDINGHIFYVFFRRLFFLNRHIKTIYEKEIEPILHSLKDVWGEDNEFIQQKEKLETRIEINKNLIRNLEGLNYSFYGNPKQIIDIIRDGDVPAYVNTSFDSTLFNACFLYSFGDDIIVQGNYSMYFRDFQEVKKILVNHILNQIINWTNSKITIVDISNIFWGMSVLFDHIKVCMSNNQGKLETTPLTELLVLPNDKVAKVLDIFFTRFLRKNVENWVQHANSNGFWPYKMGEIPYWDVTVEFYSDLRLNLYVYANIINIQKVLREPNSSETIKRLYSELHGNGFLSPQITFSSLMDYLEKNQKIFYRCIWDEINSANPNRHPYTAILVLKFLVNEFNRSFLKDNVTINDIEGVSSFFKVFFDLVFVSQTEKKK